MNKKNILITILVFSLIISSSFIYGLDVYAALTLPDEILNIGHRGQGVAEVQAALNLLGYSLTKDGIYGSQTRNTLQDFQENHPALSNDGIYGPQTKAYLLDALNGSNITESEQEPIEPNINENLIEDNTLTYNAERIGVTQIVSQNMVDSRLGELRVKEDDYEITREFNTSVPENLVLNLQYNKYSTAYDYLLVKTNTLNVRALPSTQSVIIGKVHYFDKINLIQEVRGQMLENYNSDSWYRVFWDDNGVIKTGFVFSALGEPRTYRFDHMLNEVTKLQNTVSNSKIGYIYNYKNAVSYPPAHNGTDEDAYGRSRSQSAPGYIDLNKSDFRYFSDGMVVSIIDETDQYYKVNTPSFEGEYFIPKQYISFKNAPEELKKVIVIDDINQNEGVFQWTGDQWELISFTYATTGTKGEYKFETPKGHFMAIEKKPYFLYLEDGTTKITGFAPHTIRFSGGGYIHGVPIEFKVGETHYNTSPTNPENHEEYLFTIGTTPRSHKCVRNFTSHAEFLYNWATIGDTMFIVIN